jgi:3',5'-cyclic AMP phosphodiesterase CpdA
MPTIAHISDLHFGTEDPAVAEGLLRDLEAIQPALVVITGDLTQRARASEFRAARAYLDRIPFPQLTVPGNHDIPFYDVIRRFYSPLTRYKKYITPNLAPRFDHDQFVVLGVNTARSATWKNGRISLEQIQEIQNAFCSLPFAQFKVLATHHPFVPPPDDPTPALVGRGRRAMDALDECGADLLLAGHLHRHYSADAKTHHVRIKRTILVAQAGTAISHRRRNEPNAYNLITLIPPQVEIQVRAWTGKKFEPVTAVQYQKIENAWTRKETPGAPR